MKRRNPWCLSLCLLSLLCLGASGQEIVFETTSPYHHIQVIDRNRLRTLHFDKSTQSHISLDDPLKGHFEYIEYFHMPWLWDDQIKSVLMIGLGGSSIQRAYQAHYPEVKTTTIELDPKVIDVAKTYFNFKETDNMKVLSGDGRMYMRRTKERYDAIFLDAYAANRYGTYIPYPLVTREFFALARERLSDRGVLVYNVIGNVTSSENIVGAIYKTLKTSFPQVYMFPAETTPNVVLMATLSSETVTLSQLQARLEALNETRAITFTNFKLRLERFQAEPPASVGRSRVLTDDFAPVDGLLQVE